MFELPEFLNLAHQINETLQGKTIRHGRLGNSPHKFVWYNRSHEEFSALVAGKTVGYARTRGKWLFVPLDPGYVLLFGECGGKMLYHPPATKLPSKFHLALTFEDGSSFTATTQMWGAMELFEQGQECGRLYVKDMRLTPVEPEFTFEYFSELVDTLSASGKRSVKSLLTQDQLIPGLGNSIAQDIMFRARLHPRREIGDLNRGQKRDLYAAIQDTLREAIEKGGRYDEVNLFNQPGGYVRLMDRHAAGKPCPECGHTVEKIQYLGGACYFCPVCQAA
jgi:formamidopyrimidine-DNA glycosylase